MKSGQSPRSHADAHSLLAAAPEDLAHLRRQTAEVAAVQTHPHGPVAQLTQSQSHRAEVQQAAAERQGQGSTGEQPRHQWASGSDTCWSQ